MIKVCMNCFNCIIKESPCISLIEMICTENPQRKINCLDTACNKFVDENEAKKIMCKDW